MREKTLHPEPREQEAARLPFHPLAIKYGGDLPKNELDALAQDIATIGQLFPIIVHEGQIIAGIQRYRACLQAKVGPVTAPYDVQKYGGTEANIAAFIIGENVHRRHLTPKQRRAIIAELLKENPIKSDRAIAKNANCDNKTVASVRAEKERCEEIPHVEERTDTRGRQQPASKSRSKSARPPSTRLMDAWRDATSEERTAFVAKIKLTNLYMLAPNTQKNELADFIREMDRKAKTNVAATSAEPGVTAQPSASAVRDDGLGIPDQPSPTHAEERGCIIGNDDTIRAAI